MGGGQRDLTPLAQLKNLSELSLARTDVSDLTSLVVLKKLQRLDLNRTKVTDEQIKQLQLALPNCVISR